MTALRRLSPVIVILAIFAGLYLSGANQLFTLDGLRVHETALRRLVEAHPVVSVLIYIALYAAVCAACLPMNLIAMLAAGLLFGPWIGGAATVGAATLGSTVSYFAARTSLGNWLMALADRKSGTVKKIVEGFGEYAFSYVLSLRLFPVFPFWMVSLAASFARPPMWAYVLGTAVGVIPTAFVYAGVGAGLAKVFEDGGEADISVIFAPHVIWPLVGLALLSLAPAIAGRFKREA